MTVTKFGDIGKTCDHTEAKFHPIVVKIGGIAASFCDKPGLNFKTS